MLELKRRLLETEDQMTRILRAMESVQEKVGDLSDDLPPQVRTQVWYDREWLSLVWILNRGYSTGQMPVG